ncbi:MAG: PAS domain S-box protein [Chromatiales bacterium]|nr:PAS domain S-box protein [Chromatiales bacterium]
MSTPTTGAGHPARLRADAEGLIMHGAAPPARGSAISVDALALLHRLAGSPDSAADALKLLHELQVHQVELDLQHGQFEANELDLAQGLARYRAFFESAPVGCLVVSLDGQVIEANAAAVTLLGIGQTAVEGRPLESLVAPQSRPGLATLLEDLRNGSPTASRELQPASLADTGQPPFRVSASYSPQAAAVLMILAPPDPAKGD